MAIEVLLLIGAQAADTLPKPQKFTFAACIRECARLWWV
jgi:hypothetical protein